MRLSAEHRLHNIAQNERQLGSPIGMGEADIRSIEAAADVCEAAEALLEDIRRRHPGEDFTCPFIIALSTALDKVADA